MEFTKSLENEIRTVLDEENFLQNKIYRGEELEGFFGGKLEAQNVVFENCRFLCCDFTKAYFSKVQFLNCDCSNSDFSDSYWSNSIVSRTKAQGAKFTNGVLKKTHFEFCKLDYANFGQAVLEDTSMVSCSFISAFLSELKLKRSSFHQNRFESTDFFKTSLKGVDLSDCELEGVLLSENFWEIKGAKLNALQAVEIAKLLGIHIV